MESKFCLRSCEAKRAEISDSWGGFYLKIVELSSRFWQKLAPAHKQQFLLFQVTVWDYDRFGANEFLGKNSLRNNKKTNQTIYKVFHLWTELHLNVRRNFEMFWRAVSSNLSQFLIILIETIQWWNSEPGQVREGLTTIISGPFHLGVPPPTTPKKSSCILW